MRVDRLAAPAEKNGAKNRDTKVLLHYVAQICQRHWPGVISKPRVIQSKPPATVDKYTRMGATIEEMADKKKSN